MTAIDIDRHLEIDKQGQAYIAGRRISVALIAIQHVEHGESFEAIAEDYDLAPAQIYAAMAFYHDHKDAIDHEIVAEGLRATEFASANPDIMLKSA